MRIRPSKHSADTIEPPAPDRGQAMCAVITTTILGRAALRYCFFVVAYQGEAGILEALFPVSR